MNNYYLHIVFMCCIFISKYKFVKSDEENILISARLATHQYCDTDLDCKENSFCYGNDNGVRGNCKCREPYLTNKNRTYYECLLPSGYGEHCIRDLQCLLQAGSASYCSNSEICTCQYNAHLASDNKCYFSKSLGQICLTRNECRLSDGTYAYCDRGYCVCPPLYHPASDLLHCISSVALGQPCDNDENCNHTNAVCDDVCKCSVNHVESRDGTECYPVLRNFGDSCMEGGQCSRVLHKSICINDRCGCRTDNHEYISYNKDRIIGCHRNASVGAACDLKEECVLSPVMDNSVDCVNGICSCTYSTSNNEFGCEIVINSAHVASSRYLILMVLFRSVKFIFR